LREPHIFAGNPLDRGEQDRRDENWIIEKARDTTSRFLPMAGSTVLVNSQSEPDLGWVGKSILVDSGCSDSGYYLGSMEDICYFAVDVNNDDDVKTQLCERTGYSFEDARSTAEGIDKPKSGILAQGRAQINWHNRHKFCSVCGGLNEPRRGGQKLQCASCGAEHFPRTDPVIIMLVYDGDRCLLGQSRGRLARMNRYSALAGFMDQGESIEEGVAREIREEAGIEIKNVRYHSSQPWPFPSSLMIGCLAEAASTDIDMDPEEMTDVRWFSRDEVLLALEKKNDELQLPDPIAIAHHLIRSWASGDV